MFVNLLRYVPFSRHHAKRQSAQDLCLGMITGMTTAYLSHAVNASAIPPSLALPALSIDEHCGIHLKTSRSHNKAQARSLEI